MSGALLHVAEKPSVARAVAETLSGGRSRKLDGTAIPVWEFDAAWGPFGQRRHYVTSVAGHLKSTDFVSPYDEWQSCDPVELFRAPIASYVPPEAIGIASQLKRFSRQAGILVLWLDCDREGEGIAYEVIEECTARSDGNPRLDIYRAKFSGITPNDIRTAMSRLGRPDKRMADAVAARQELDLRLGAAFTRLQTISLANRFNDLAGKLLSYGPCQFPTLGFVVERYLAIKAFIPRRFWSINMTLMVPADGASSGSAGGGGGGWYGAAGAGAGDDDDDEDNEDTVVAAEGGAGGQALQRAVSTRGRVRYSIGGTPATDRGAGGAGGVGRGGGGGPGAPRGPGGGADAGAAAGGQPVYFSWSRERLFDQLAASVIYELVVEAGEATVVSVTGNDTSRYKPLPMNSVDFAMLASRSLRMDSQHAAKIAEDLYSKGILSYPRTETQIFKEEPVASLVEAHASHPVWGSYVRRLTEGGEFEPPRAGGKDDGAHPPIHPLRCVTQAEMQSHDHWRVYELVTRHFLACCSRDARGKSSRVTVEMGGETFSAGGLIVTQRGFLDVYPYTAWHGSKLPVFTVGQRFVPSSVLLVDGATAPPPMLAEHELIEAMHVNGIGTDATIPEHIAKVQDRE